MSRNPYTSMAFKVDWLSYTIPPKNDKNFAMLDYLKYDRGLFEPIPGRYFYNSGVTIGHFFNLYYDDPSKKVSKFSALNHLYVWTGQGSTDLAQKLAKRYKNDDFMQDWLEYFKYLVSLSFKPTRIDLALDDFYGALNLNRLERKLRRGEYRSSKKRYNVVKQLDTAGNIKGHTIYVGQSRGKSSVNGGYFVRFYDKYAESQSKAVIMPKQVEDVITGGGSHHWVRAEIQFNKHKAVNLINEVLNRGSFGLVYMEVMRNIIEFLKPNRNEKNKNRWKVCDWWERFLNGAGKSTLGDPERDMDLGRLLRWIRVAVVPSIHLLQELGDNKGFNIYDLIAQCKVNGYQKKQVRLLMNAEAMPDRLIKFYLKNFIKGYGPNVK